MFAIYKRELKSYFTSMTGPVFIAFLMLFIGIYFTIYNIVNGLPTFGYALYGVSFVFMISVPVLTMRSFAEEQKNRTDQLLYTSPVGTGSVVMGKYLAMVTVMGIVALLSCVCPLIISMYGTEGLLIDYSCIFAFFLIGAAYIAMGMFLSSLTESQIIACVTSFGLFFLLYYITDISSLIGSSAQASAVAFSAVFLAAGLIVYMITKNVYMSVLVSCIGIIGVLIIFLAKPALLAGSFPGILKSFSLIDRFANFVYQMFDWTSILYYLSISFVFVFLTMQSIQKKRWS